MKRILNLLGLAKKAGKLVTGEDSVILSLQKKETKLVFVAKDASIQTIDKFEKKCFFYKVECISIFTCDELSNAIGSDRKVIGVTDSGFANAINLKLRGEEK